jgi:broad specificity phosphatase PhoE
MPPPSPAPAAAEMRWLIARHGETVFNAAALPQGSVAEIEEGVERVLHLGAGGERA